MFIKVKDHYINTDNITYITDENGLCTISLVNDEFLIFEMTTKEVINIFEVATEEVINGIERKIENKNFISKLEEELK